MEVEFDQTIEDFVNYNLYHMEHSRTIKRRIFTSRIIFAMMVILLSLVLLFLIERQINVMMVTISIIGAIFMYFIIPTIYKYNTLSNVRGMLKEADNKSILGKRVLEISDKGIIYKNIAGEGSYNWQSIIRIEENDQYIFLYQSSTSAIILPKRAFASIEEKKEFTSLLSEEIKRK